VLQHFLENPCCKHIVLGSCHDNGYVCHLDVIGSNSSLRDRITLLKSFQTGRQYGNLPFRSIHLPSLFRTQTFSASGPKNGASNGTTLATPDLSYAARAGVSGSSTVAPAPPSLTDTIYYGTILVNAKGERLDRILKKPSQVAFTNYHSKKKKLEATGKRGPCNLHYLGDGCTMVASSCQYWHDGFNKADVTVLKWLMRYQGCDKKLDCKSASCFYGHAWNGVNRTGEHEVPGE